MGPGMEGAGAGTPGSGAGALMGAMEGFWGAVLGGVAYVGAAMGAIGEVE